MKEQLFELFPEQAKKHTSTRKRQRNEEPSEDTYSGDEVMVEDVFSLESGWSVEALGEDDDMMQIGDDVRFCPVTALACCFLHLSVCDLLPGQAPIQVKPGHVPADLV